MRPIRHRKLADQLVDRIADEISSGTWVHVLPGTRQLAEYFGVSRPTCQKALDQLARSGIVSKASAGCSRQILQKVGDASVGQPSRMLFVHDLSHPPEVDDQLLVEQIRAEWGALGGGEFLTRSFDYGRNSRPGRLLRRWIEETSANLLVLFTPQRGLVAAAERSGVPCFALGGVIDYSDGTITSAVLSLPSTVVEILRAPVCRDHSRVLVLCSRDFGEDIMQERILSRLQDSMESEGGELSADFVLKVETHTPQELSLWHTHIEQALTSFRPTLVIPENVQETVALHSYCAKRTISVPEELSIFAVSDAAVLDCLDPPVTRLRIDDGAFRKFFRSWLRRGMSPGELYLMRTEMVRGETVGKTAQTGEERPPTF